MFFNSYIFILAFLPCVLILYWGANHLQKYSLGKNILLAASIIFYSWFDLRMLLAVLCFCTVNYLIVNKGIKNKEYSKFWMRTGVIANILVLGYFKYTNFFIDSVNEFLGKEISTLNILVPVGLSFFIFQQICYIVDSYHSYMVYSVRDYLLHSLFFPYIISGSVKTTFLFLLKNLLFTRIIAILK